MLRAEAGTRGGLPPLERSSFDPAPFINCLQKRELDNFLVFRLFPVAVLSGLHLLVGNLPFMHCFFVCLRAFDAHFQSVLIGEN